MKPKTMILMIVAVVCGLGASWMTSRLLAERNQPEPEQQPKVTVLVAKKNIDMGTTIKNPAALFVEKQFVQEDAPKEAITEFAVLKDKMLKRPRRAGDSVTLDDLWDRNAMGMVGLPDGMRAIGLPVRLDTIAAGFASLPGSKVDIIFTGRGLVGSSDSFSDVLFEDVLVLAADSNDVRPDGTKVLAATVVTVALSPEDVLKASLAMELGTMRLVLRPFGDQKKLNVEQFTGKQLVSGSKDKDKLPTPEGVEKGPEGPAAGPTVKGLEVPDVARPDAGLPDVKQPEAPLTQELPAAAPPKIHTMVIWNNGERTVAKFVMGRANEEVSTQINREPPHQPRVTAPTPAPGQPPVPPPAQPQAPTKTR
jgi:Flp pilus assembly protein CpaB